MAIATPADMEKGTVSWTVGQTTRGLTVNVAGMPGIVRFTATATALTYATMTVLPAVVEAKVTDGVMQTIELIANDADVWNWQVEPMLGPRDAIIPWPAFHINVPAGGTVDLAAAAIVPGVGPVRVIEGEQGESAYDVAVANGFVGTVAEWLASLKGDGSAWSAITGKPNAFPPATHSHVVGDVTGLAARLAALEYDSGRRDVRGLLEPTWVVAASGGRAELRRVGVKATLRLAIEPTAVNTTASNAGSLVFTIPAGFLTNHYGAINQTIQTGGGSIAVQNVGSANKITVRRLDSTAPWQPSFRCYMELHWDIDAAIPTTLPGTPA